MNRVSVSFWFALYILFIAGSAVAEPEPGVYDFEQGLTGDGLPEGWRGNPPGTVFADTASFHTGNGGARIERTTDSPGEFSALSRVLPAEQEGDQVELRGWLRSEDVTGYFGLWLRLDGQGGMLALENMSSRKLKGTTDWTEYRIQLPYYETSRNIVFGALMSGEGTLWIDDLALFVDGKPIAEAPPLARVLTILDTDTEFAKGSGITLSELTPQQVDNLSLTGQVWGFLKYHHPAVTGGERHWDYDLFRVLPGVLDAADRSAAQAVLVTWIDELGFVGPAVPGAKPTVDPHLLPELDWLRDIELLGAELAARLQAAHAARPADGDQFFAGFAMGVGNADFGMERAYASLETFDTGHRILALFRHWAIIRYWFPYRDVIGTDWVAILPEFLPHMVAADDPQAYDRALLALAARSNDTHAQGWGSMGNQPPEGDGALPVLMRSIESRIVVTNYTHEILGPMSGLKIGDVVLAIDGEPVKEMMARLSPYYGASNEPTRLRALTRNLAKGWIGSCDVVIERAGGRRTLTVDRIDRESIDRMVGRAHSLPGKGFRRLAGEVAYVPLKDVQRETLPGEMKQVADAPALIIDCRSYPADFPIFDLGGRLVTEKTEFACFTRPDGANPGAFAWSPPVSLSPITPHYGGKVVVLVDETSQSSAEYHAMAFRAAPGAVVMGSTTAGADGNVSRYTLPGNLMTMISGIGVFYPDRTPTQRVGIVPDIAVKPTIAGIMAGRDEVVEAALELVLERKLAEGERPALR